jgi:hypothetical protein
MRVTAYTGKVSTALRTSPSPSHRTVTLRSSSMRAGPAVTSRPEQHTYTSTAGLSTSSHHSRKLVGADSGVLGSTAP